jgi:hypothetical protein
MSIEVPDIPEDSPFAKAARGAETSTAPAPSSSEPFTFSFSLSTETTKKQPVNTFELAAPVVASDVPAAVLDAKDAGCSRKIGRPRRGKQRPSEDAQWDEGEEGYGEWDEGEGEDGEGEASPSGTGTGAAAATTAAPVALSFDASKFDLSSFAKSLPS